MKEFWKVRQNLSNLIMSNRILFGIEKIVIMAIIIIIIIIIMIIIIMIIEELG